MEKHAGFNGLEGRIHIALRPDQTVKLHSGRPVLAARVLIGKTPAEALKIIPLLFNVCGTAQSRTALSALHEALASETKPTPEAEYARDLLVRAETAREILLRLFRDGPALLDLPLPAADVFAYLGGLAQGFKSALFGDAPAFSLNALETDLKPDWIRAQPLIDQLRTFLEQHVFGIPCEAFTSIADTPALIRWSRAQNTLAGQIIKRIHDADWAAQGDAPNACLPLPDLNLQALAARLNADDAEAFIAAPDWQGECHETGPLARQWNRPLITPLRQAFGVGLLTRQAARLLELAALPKRLTALREREIPLPVRHTHTEPGAGIAGVEAARGRLHHFIRVDNGKIRQYRILAPTEWNFHPRGSVARGLSNIHSHTREERTRLAYLVIHAIDPCVAYELETG